MVRLVQARVFALRIPPRVLFCLVCVDIQLLVLQDLNLGLNI